MQNEQYLLEVGRKIKDRRIELNISQQALADMVGFKSRSSINKIEKGTNDLTQSVIVKIASALNCGLSEILGWEDNATASNIIPVRKARFCPIVGQIACGSPICADQNVESYIPVPQEIKCDFCLRCQGDSMIDAGIKNGDIVYIRECPDVDDGKIAAVLLKDDCVATLKRVYHGCDQITLMPENAAFPPIVISGEKLDDVKILGVVVAVTSIF